MVLRNENSSPREPHESGRCLTQKINYQDKLKQSRLSAYGLPSHVERIL